MEKPHVAFDIPELWFGVKFHFSNNSGPVANETDADPHNAKRGFFFSHVGWLILTPHPKVVEKRTSVDMSDLEADPIVMWQKRQALSTTILHIFNVILPVAIPVYF
ncbi:hypothetical protein NQ317_002964 [Molorchus minor]|uniref:Uncharacterized protein n=1 Tax=Molorchus minor TaxID=1323400 RepID=A0ABQ9J9N9_9CUCU|nr:hypothetical protein NQ317_002964 [Molorchus minor]